MPTYRALSLKELELFEQEFKEFLAVNGIDADLWTKIKIEDSEKVEKLIESGMPRKKIDRKWVVKDTGENLNVI